MQQFLVYRHGVSGMGYRAWTIGHGVDRNGQARESSTTNTSQPVACKILAILERSVGCTPVKK